MWNDLESQFAGRRGPSATGLKCSESRAVKNVCNVIWYFGIPLVLQVFGKKKNSGNSDLTVTLEEILRDYKH